MKVDLEFTVGEHAEIVVAKDIEGIVTAILLRHGGHLSYELTWIHDGGVKTGWFIAPELKSRPRNE